MLKATHSKEHLRELFSRLLIPSQLNKAGENLHAVRGYKVLRYFHKVVTSSDFEE